MVLRTLDVGDLDPVFKVTTGLKTFKISFLHSISCTSGYIKFLQEDHIQKKMEDALDFKLVGGHLFSSENTILVRLITEQQIIFQTCGYFTH